MSTFCGTSARLPGKAIKCCMGRKCYAIGHHNLTMAQQYTTDRNKSHTVGKKKIIRSLFFVCCSFLFFFFSLLFSIFVLNVGVYMKALFESTEVWVARRVSEWVNACVGATGPHFLKGVTFFFLTRALEQLSLVSLWELVSIVLRGCYGASHITLVFFLHSSPPLSPCVLALLIFIFVSICLFENIQVILCTRMVLFRL